MTNEIIIKTACILSQTVVRSILVYFPFADLYEIKLLRIGVINF